MARPSSAPSNGDIYQLLNDMRLELKGDISAVRTEVQEAKADITKLKVSWATLGTKVYILCAIIGGAVSIIATALVRTMFK